MKLNVSCQICGKVLVEVEKDEFSDEDVLNYEQNCSCEDDGQENIVVSKIR
jgi:hypothetical protein